MKYVSVLRFRKPIKLLIANFLYMAVLSCVFSPGFPLFNWGRFPNFSVHYMQSATNKKCSFTTSNALLFLVAIKLFAFNISSLPLSHLWRFRVMYVKICATQQCVRKQGIRISRPTCASAWWRKMFGFVPELAVHFSTSYFIDFHVTTFRKLHAPFLHMYFFSMWL